MKSCEIINSKAGFLMDSLAVSAKFGRRFTVHLIGAEYYINFNNWSDYNTAKRDALHMKAEDFDKKYPSIDNNAILNTLLGASNLSDKLRNQLENVVRTVAVVAEENNNIAGDDQMNVNKRPLTKAEVKDLLRNSAPGKMNVPEFIVNMHYTKYVEACGTMGVVAAGEALEAIIAESVRVADEIMGRATASQETKPYTKTELQEAVRENLGLTKFAALMCLEANLDPLYEAYIGMTVTLGVDKANEEIMSAMSKSLQEEVAEKSQESSCGNCAECSCEGQAPVITPDSSPLDIADAIKYATAGLSPDSSTEEAVAAINTIEGLHAEKTASNKVAVMPSAQVERIKETEEYRVQHPETNTEDAFESSLGKVLEKALSEAGIKTFDASEMPDMHPLRLGGNPTGTSPVTFVEFSQMVKDAQMPAAEEDYFTLYVDFMEFNSDKFDFGHSSLEEYVNSQRPVKSAWEELYQRARG